jgi:hypothetical protein
VHQDTLASSLGILLSLWSYDGLIARYPKCHHRVDRVPLRQLIKPGDARLREVARGHRYQVGERAF